MKALPALLALFFLTPAVAGDRVIWPIDDFPPAYIVSGEFAGTGIGDQEIRYLTERLGEFANETLQVSNSRAWAMLAEQDGVCIAGAYETPERRKIAAYSRVALTILGPQILIRSDEAERFQKFQNAAGEIDLDRLGAASELRAARPAGRPLGNTMEEFARAHAIPTLPVSHQALSMLDSGRLDYSLGYANELTYYRKTHPGSGRLTALKVAGLPRIIYLHVACSARAVGRRVVARVDEILGPHGAPPYFQSPARRWYDNKDFQDLASLARWP